MLENGTMLQDRYVINEPLGVGGMGAVYLAVDQKFGSRVAIKQTLFDNAELAQAFEREARLLNTLHHPVLPYVSDYFSEGDQHFLVMEYIEGEDVSEVLKRDETISIDDVLKWTFELLDAVDYLHSQSPPIVHRDIKPGNLRLTERRNIVLLDFGLAKETSGNTQGLRSVFGYSRRYSPLEQIEGTGTDERSDIFSLGATIFHLLTGNPPVDVLARASAIVAGKPDPLQQATELNPHVPAEFAHILKTALSLNPGDRFISAPAMRTAIEHAFNLDASVMSAPTLAETEDLNSPAEVAKNELAVNGDDPVERPFPVTSAATADGESTAPRTNVGKVFGRRPWWTATPALIAILLAALTVVSFGIYRFAISPAATDSPAQPIGEASPVDDQTGAGANDVSSPPIVSPQAPSTERLKAQTAPKPAKERPVSPEPESRVDETEVATRPVPRPRIASTSRHRQEVVVEEELPPVSSIETIFTGRPPGPGEWRGRDKGRDWDKERRRRIKQMRKQHGTDFPPF